ncbi:MAG: YbjN domain-containing protein [Bryobacteraceae bacterium]
MGLFGSKGSAPPVFYTISGEEMAQIVREEGYVPELDHDSHGDPLIRFRVEGYNCLLFFYGVEDGRAMSLQFRAAFREQAPLEKVNEWNRRKRFLKVYLDEDGDINIDMDVDLEGGVTRAYLAERLRTWRAAFLTCVRFLAD